MRIPKKRELLISNDKATSLAEIVREKLSQGVDPEDIPERTELIVETLKLVQYVAKDYQDAYNFEDLVSEARLATLNATDRFIQGGINIPYKFYVCRQMENKIKRYLHTCKKDKLGENFTRIPPRVAEENECEMILNRVAAKEQIQYILDRFKFMSITRQLALILYTGFYGGPEMSFSAIARLFNRTPQSVSQLINHELLTSKDELDEYMKRTSRHRCIYPVVTKENYKNYIQAVAEVQKNPYTNSEDFQQRIVECYNKKFNQHDRIVDVNSPLTPLDSI